MSGDTGNSLDRLISIEIAIVTKYSDEERCFYALSPQLRCVRDGDTAEEAVALCREALEVLFESLIERKTLQAHLLDNGYEEVPVEIDGKSGIIFALKEGNLIPQGQIHDEQAITSAPFTGVYKQTIHPRRACVGV
jgi:predicted RNase H-like HicB family nuclease